MHSVKPHLEQNEKLMGEALLLSVIGGMVDPRDAQNTLLKAEAMIGGSSRILTPETRFAENYFDAFMLWGKKPGHADIIRDWGLNMDKTTEVFQHLTGFGAGVKESHRAQLAYYRGDFDEAMKWASTELPGGMQGQTSLLKVYLLEIAAGVAKHTMNQPLWRRSYGQLKAIASGEQPASRSCREQAEVVCAMLDMSLGCLHDVPAWTKSGDFGAIPAPHGYEIVKDRLLVSTMPSAMVAHMEYLSYSGEPIRALQVAAMLQQVLGVSNVVLDSYVSLLRAGCYINLERPDYARRAVEDAMRMIAPDRLWLIAADFVPAFGELICEVAAEYDSSAPEKIRSIGDGILDKLTPLRNEMLRGSSEGLTKREQEVMNLVMQGHSNAEIAEQLNVSVRTVRFHLENVYSKLNITRRSKFAADIEQTGAQKLAHWVK